MLAIQYWTLFDKIIQIHFHFPSSLVYSINQNLFATNKRQKYSLKGKYGFKMTLISFWADIYFVSAWKNYLRTNNCSALYSFILSALLRIDPFITAYNAPDYRIYLVRIFSYLGWIREYMGWQSTYSRIQSKCGNMLTR